MNEQGERRLQSALGVEFRDPALLRLAVTHRSIVHERPLEAPESNERLEFLGDALLGLVIAEELYRRFPEEPEGRLTEMRANLVRAETLAGIATGLGVGDSLYLGRGEDQSGGRQRRRNLSAALEAILGAVLVDQGHETAAQLVRALFREALSALASDAPWNYKSLLQEEVQAIGRKAPVYQILSEEGPEHTRVFAVEVSIEGETLAVGRGMSKQKAEQEAARAAYGVLRGIPAD